jgi:hypothetical protein
VVPFRDSCCSQIRVSYFRRELAMGVRMMPDDFTSLHPAWFDGAEAHAIGIPSKRNPYVVHGWFSPAATAWWAGWWDAQTLLGRGR